MLQNRMIDEADEDQIGAGKIVNSVYEPAAFTPTNLVHLGYRLSQLLYLVAGIQEACRYQPSRAGCERQIPSTRK